MGSSLALAPSLILAPPCALPYPTEVETVSQSAPPTPRRYRFNPLRRFINNGVEPLLGPSPLLWAPPWPQPRPASRNRSTISAANSSPTPVRSASLLHHNGVEPLLGLSPLLGPSPALLVETVSLSAPPTPRRHRFDPLRCFINNGVEPLLGLGPLLGPSPALLVETVSLSAPTAPRRHRFDPLRCFINNGVEPLLGPSPLLWAGPWPYPRPASRNRFTISAANSSPTQQCRRFAPASRLRQQWQKPLRTS